MQPNAPRKLASAACLAALVASAPLAADKVLVMRSHTDAMQMMGTKTPAQDIDHEYWFGPNGTRFDAGETSVIVRTDAKKLYFVNHDARTYSTINLPFTFEQIVPDEMAPMIEMMMKSMAASTTVTPTDRTGEFAGVSCNYSKVNISMGMMQMAMDICSTEKLPIDISRYKALQEMQGELAPNSQWIKEMAEKIKGFPVRSDTSTTVMGKTFGSSSELTKVEDRPAPAGQYDPPAGYQEVKYDPMAQAQARKKK
ncbi:MAG: DUF4412 domain-containing protein [Thermoanaerobaculia bacterium]